jgi:hypothetical protein
VLIDTTTTFTLGRPVLLGLMSLRPPEDPLTYRHKKKNAHQNLGSNNNNTTSKAADGTQQPPEANNVSTSFQSIPKTGDNKPSSSIGHTEKVLEEILKFEEFNRLTYRHYDSIGSWPFCNSRIDEFNYCACGGNLGVGGRRIHMSERKLRFM